MTKKKSNIIYSVLWLLIGGLIEFFSLLLMIYAYLDYRVSYISSNPIFTQNTDYTIAAIGFALSLACILVCIQKIGKDNKQLDDLFKGKKD